ncbi:MAG: hypothetical protein C0520_06500 [Sphingopyxis sp.]|nr:hypothetical protein [Sphingopyxis sp.]
MPVCPVLLSSLALCCAGAAEGHPEMPEIALPRGDGEAFERRMTDWSVPEQKPAPVVPQSPATRAAMPRLSSGYGYRTDPVRGGARMHRGLDIPGPVGTPVLASDGGVVAFAGSAGSYGRMVEIDHGRGLRTRYAHLSRLLVRAGDTVGPQQPIALMGSTGRSTGSHLHFEVRENGRSTDPLPLLGQPARAARPAFAETAPHISDFARRRAEASTCKDAE